MFYSYKNFPITIESYDVSGRKNCEFADYTLVAQNISLSTSPNANFTFPLKSKKPYRGFNTEGLTSTIQIAFISQTPYDNMFFNNIFCESGIKHNFKIQCGDSLFESGYLRSFTASINPNNLIQNQAEFIFFNTGNSNFNGSSGFRNYPVNSNNSSYFSHGVNTMIAFNDGYNEFNKHEIRSIDFNYRANIQPIYDVDTTYPSRVIFNREEIDLNVDLDQYELYIRDINNIISGTKIIYTGLHMNSTGIEIYLKSGFLINKNYSARLNDVINSRISLKYFI